MIEKQALNMTKVKTIPDIFHVFSCPDKSTAIPPGLECLSLIKRPTKIPAKNPPK